MFGIHQKRLETRLDLSCSVFPVGGSHASQSFLIAKVFHQQGTSGLLPAHPHCCTSLFLRFFHISRAFANCSISPPKITSAQEVQGALDETQPNDVLLLPGSWDLYLGALMCRRMCVGVQMDQLFPSSPFCGTAAANSAVWLSLFKHNALCSIAQTNHWMTFYSLQSSG